jgi:hypothetical protein
LTTVQKCHVHSIVDSEDDGEGCCTECGAVEDGDRIGIPSCGWAELRLIESDAYSERKLHCSQRRSLQFVIDFLLMAIIYFLPPGEMGDTSPSLDRSKEVTIPLIFLNMLSSLEDVQSYTREDESSVIES